jgi:hypothetical protein
MQVKLSILVKHQHLLFPEGCLVLLVKTLLFCISARKRIVIIFLYVQDHESERHIDGRRIGALAERGTCLRQRHQSRDHVRQVHIGKDHDLCFYLQVVHVFSIH